MIPSSADYMRILPELIFCLFGALIMLADPVMPARSSRKSLGVLACIGCLLALGGSVAQGNYHGLAFSGMVRVDAFSIFFHCVVAMISAAVVLASYEYLQVQQIRAGEYYALILFGSAGMALMSSAVELVLIFIALEISSISTYVLAGLRRRAATSAEASLKYFLLGSFATAFFLYGIALMFGATGTTNTAEIARLLCSGATPVANVRFLRHAAA